MKKKDKISIVVPVFNGEIWIQSCIESLINQSYRNIEIIIVDDGSTDNTQRYVKSYMIEDPRITLLEQENQGVSVARNTGLKCCTGNFVCFVDSDDTIDRDFCQTMMCYMNDDIDAVVCGLKVFRNGKMTIDAPHAGIISGEEASQDVLQSKNLSFLVTNKLHRVSIFRSCEIDFPSGLMYEDLLVSYKYCQAAHRIQYIADALYCYNRRKGSLCKNYDHPRRIKDYIEIIKKVEDITPNNITWTRALLVFFHNALVRLTSYYLKSNYDGNDTNFKESASYIIERIKSLNARIDDTH